MTPRDAGGRRAHPAASDDERLLRYRRDIGLSFQSKDDPNRKLGRDIAILRQRRLDSLAVLPDRADILRSIDKKLEKRERQLAEALAGAAPVTDGDED